MEQGAQARNQRAPQLEKRDFQGTGEQPVTPVAAIQTESERTIPIPLSGVGRRVKRGCMKRSCPFGAFLRRTLKENSPETVLERNKQTERSRVYVDDLLITGSKTEMIDEFKSNMSNKFEMSDLGLLTYYLGIEVVQSNEGIFIKQASYAKKVLEETSMIDCNATQFPMDAGLKLSKAEQEASVDEKDYRRVIGCLRYLVHTRTDLSYSVGVISRYMHEPKTSHWMALKQVLRYVKSTLAYGLNFLRSSKAGWTLTGYSDSSHNVDIDDG
ncbi:uncharacterized mitochondrial protein AtMg00810-like [Brassica rapa]|uniref:uncharacterized mitochondrial protein AtMg00810-like n=1 Tax=Brassica campestris TaxID=3711 RepID=UPI00142E80BC|nr:uncharacterized mitochondrial protein AtMg00810-like [Brassica rapa]